MLPWAIIACIENPRAGLLLTHDRCDRAALHHAPFRPQQVASDTSAGLPNATGGGSSMSALLVLSLLDDAHPMRRIVVFPPGCTRCGSPRLAFLEYMSRYHPTDDWFQCDACGHFSTVARPLTARALHTRLGLWLLATVGVTTLTILARRAGLTVKSQTDDFMHRLIEAAHERRRAPPSHS